MIQKSYIILLEVLAQTAKDPLIDWQAENILKIAIVAMVIVLTIIVRAIIPRVEHAIIFALVSSLIVIAFFIIH